MTPRERGLPQKAQLHLKGAHSRATFWARARFLELIEEIKPEVITVLQDDVLPAFSQLHDRLGWVVADAIASRTGRSPFEIIRDKAGHEEPARQLLDALDRWQTVYRLRGPWIENAVLQALSAWSRQPGAEMPRGRWPDEFKQLGWVPTDPKPPTALRAYNPFEETRSDYLSEMRETLRSYAEQVEEMAAARFAADEWPTKTAQGKRPSDQHLRWCLRYLTGDTQYEISFQPDGDEPPAPPRSSLEKSKVDEGTVRRGIHNAADQLGLTLP